MHRSPSAVRARRMRANAPRTPPGRSAAVLVASQSLEQNVIICAGLCVRRNARCFAAAYRSFDVTVSPVPPLLPPHACNRLTGFVADGVAVNAEYVQG